MNRRVGRVSSPAVSSRWRWPGGCGFRGLFSMRQGRGSEATEAVLCLHAKKPLHTGVCTECHSLISLSVCLSLCVTFVVFLVARAVRGRFSQTR